MTNEENIRDAISIVEYFTRLKERLGEKKVAECTREDVKNFLRLKQLEDVFRPEGLEAFLNIK